MSTQNNDFAEIEKRLGVTFDDKSLIKGALTHRSYLNENKDYKLGHNERIEFLGDAVLELLVTEKLYADYPNETEGKLTSVRAATVRTETLAEMSRKLGYGKHLLMSHGEEATGGREREYILANTFEAVLGAIYLDKGMRACREFLKRELFPLISKIIEEELYIDNKSSFQEVAQEEHKETPHYELIEESGPDHEKIFEMAVFIGDKEFGRGKGKNKQTGEQEAAGDALKKFKNVVE